MVRNCMLIENRLNVGNRWDWLWSMNKNSLIWQLFQYISPFVMINFMVFTQHFMNNVDQNPILKILSSFAFYHLIIIYIKFITNFSYTQSYCLSLLFSASKLHEFMLWKAHSYSNVMSMSSEFYCMTAGSLKHRFRMKNVAQNWMVGRRSLKANPKEVVKKSQ